MTMEPATQLLLAPELVEQRHMKLDRITGHSGIYGGGLNAFCPACMDLNGSPLSELNQIGETLPDNLRLYVCRFCQHQFEVEQLSSAMAVIAPVVSQGASTITAPCPWCGNPEEHKAETCLVECHECHANYVLQPQIE